jgi:hypothetical protein
MRLTSSLRVTAVIAVLLLACSAMAGVVTRHIEFSEPTIISEGDYYRIAMTDAWSYGDPGEPMLPLAGVRLLLPPGEVVSEIRVTPGARVVLGDGYVIEPGQMQYPLSHAGPRRIAEADYTSGSTYPAALHSEPVSGRYRGYGITNVALSPVEYEAGSGTVSYYASMDIEIITEPDPAGMRGVEKMIVHDDATLARVSRMVDNPGDVIQYAGIERVAELSRVLDPALAYNYIIVTTNAWDSYLDTYVEWRTQRGQKVGVFTKEWIVLNYAGTDAQMQIRNFIIDAYATWTPDYVLLVGDGEPSDSNGIPARGFYNTAYGETDTNIASDLYYSALDGTWNADGDGYYGEAVVDGEDYYPEVAIGRVACSGPADITNFITKTQRYSDTPIVSECDEALMVGELLWTGNPDTYGGTYKDEIMNGSNHNGYTTTGFPGTMNVGTLYDRDATWSKTTLINLMETGMNIVNHLGHCNVDWFMNMTSADIPSFDNDGTVHSLNFAYSQGCYGGSFDNRTTSFGYGSDCFAENFAGDDDGAVAVITNTRYGWGDPGGTNGSSQYFDREFFDAIFAENIYPLGYVNNDSKIDVLWAINTGANRWCYYELTLFGDPAMELWTAEPIALTATHSPTVMVGQPDFEVSIADASRGAVEGAIVTIYTDDFSVYDTGVTDATGSVTLHPNASSVETMHVKATVNNHLVSNTTADIIPTSGVYLALDSYIIDDDTTGDSNGNDDGEVGASENIELPVTVGNFGTDMAYGVTATLSSTSGRIDIRDAYEEFGDIAGSGTATSPDGFEFSVNPDTPDGEVIPLTLTMSNAASRETWESYINIIVHAPVIGAQGYVVDDPPSGGNGNGCFEASETVEITVTLKNTGSVMSTGVTGTLTTADANATILGGTATIVFLNPDGSGVLSPSFSVLLPPVTPQGHEIVFDLAIEADWGYSSSAQLSLVTNGDFIDDIEAGEGEWTHDNITAGFGDQWHVDTYRSNSTTHSWKFGGTGAAGYGDSSDGVLVSKSLCLGADGEMTFWHWMDAEEESSTSAWDCGLVEISIDGGSAWDVLHPVAGYSHAKNDNNANPLPEGTPCWSGSFAWRQETFDLTSYEDEKVQIRFHFASDGAVTEEGWYVDDINITSSLPQTSVPEDEEIPRTFALRQNVPNPFNPVTVIQYQLPSEAHVTIDVFNIAGKLVTTLVDEAQDAGVKAVTWDGTNATGEKVASGIYMYRMQAGDHASRKMMVLLK